MYNNEMMCEVWHDSMCLLQQIIDPMEIAYIVKVLDSRPHYEGEFMYLKYLESWVEITGLVKMTEKQLYERATGVSLPSFDTNDNDEIT